MDSRQKILDTIQKALDPKGSVPLVEEAAAFSKISFTAAHEDISIAFARRFTETGGLFSYGENLAEVVTQLIQLCEQRGFEKVYCNDSSISSQLQQFGWTLPFWDNLESCQAAITGCAYAIARTGSLVITPETAGGRLPSVYAPVHICIVFSNQVLPDLAEAWEALSVKYGTNLPSFISFATGPSRTADIEKTLVTGVHGPKDVYCLLVEEKSDF